MPPGKLRDSLDERTGDSCLGFDFPTRLQGRSFEVVDDDLAGLGSYCETSVSRRGSHAIVKVRPLPAGIAHGGG